MEEDFTESHLRSVGESPKSEEENEISQDREPSRRISDQESLPKDESESASGVSNISTPEEQSTTSGSYSCQESGFRVKSGVSDDQSSQSIRKSEKTSEIKKRLSTDPIMPAMDAKLFIGKSLPLQESTASRFPESLQREHLDSTLHPLDLSRTQETKSSLSTEEESVSETMGGVHDPESKDQHEHTSEIRRRLSSEPMLPVPDIDIQLYQRLLAGEDMTQMETESREKNGSGLCSQMAGPQLVSDRLNPSSGELSTVQDHSLGENQSTINGSITSKSANHQERRSILTDLLSSSRFASLSTGVGQESPDKSHSASAKETSEKMLKLSLSDLKASCANFFDNAPRRIEEFFKFAPPFPKSDEQSAAESLEKPAAGPPSWEPGTGSYTYQEPFPVISGADADHCLTYEEIREIESRICEGMSSEILEIFSEIPEPQPRATRASNFPVPPTGSSGSTSFPVPHATTSGAMNLLVHESNSGPSNFLVPEASDEYLLENNLPGNETVEDDSHESGDLKKDES